jgi:cyclophilin family peptidyl-prolyl cis-trans isomerase
MTNSRPKRLPLLILLVLAATAATATTAAGGSTRAVAATGAGCRIVPRPRSRSAPRRHDRPPQTVTKRDHLVAVVKTNCGSFQIALDARRSPTIVNSFVYLARSGFYDGLLFYRVAPHFVIEGGTPHNKGFGGPGYGVTEPPPAAFHYRFGTVAMAKTATQPSGRAGSDFFVVTGGGRYIKNEYAILGRVRSGVATVKRIDALGTQSERPSQVIRIDSIRIKREG